MAVTWDVRLAPDGLAMRATGVRIDDTLPAEDGVTSHTVVGTYNTVDNTKAQLLQMFANAIWDKYQHDKGKASRIDAIKAEAETALASELESRET